MTSVIIYIHFKIISVAGYLICGKIYTFYWLYIKTTAFETFNVCCSLYYELTLLIENRENYCALESDTV
jgi:hypothetical protein